MGAVRDDQNCEDLIDSLCRLAFGRVQKHFPCVHDFEISREYWAAAVAPIEEVVVAVVLAGK